VTQLNLHSGGKLVEYDALRALQTPPRTATHVPLPHAELVSMVKYALGYYGHEIISEDHAVTDDHQRYFGLLSLRSQYGDYTDTLGLRNSHDRKFPIGIAFGSCVFVCSNLAFSGTHVITRKHTANSRRDLPALIAEIVEPLKEKRLLQGQAIERYKHVELNDQAVDHAVLTMYRKGIINLGRVPDVLNQFENPSYDWGPKTAWRLFNSATFALAGRVAEKPDITKQLHQIIDATCEEVH
jgi:hypothetical protein